MSEHASTERPHICLTFWGNLKHDARTIRTAAALVDAGARVTVVCTDTLGDLARVERHEQGFLIRRVRRPSPRRLRIVDGRPRIGILGAAWAALRGVAAQIALAAAAFRTRADAYHVADIFPLIATWVVAKARRRPVVYEAYEISTDREGFQPLVGLVRVVERFLAARVDGMFATTGMRADHFARIYDIERPQILQNRPPYRCPVPSDRLRRRCGIAAETPVVLYQGGLQPGRGLFNFIAAASKVDRAAFVLLGNGILEAALRERVNEIGSQANIHVLPAVPAEQLHEWTCSADIGVQILENTCLNHYTTDSNKLFEYVMAGLPVVASDFPEIRAVVQGHELGVLVDPDDVQGIARQIQDLVDDPGRRRRYRKNALSAARDLSWETQIPVLTEMYRRLGILAETGVGGA